MTAVKQQRPAEKPEIKPPTTPAPRVVSMRELRRTRDQVRDQAKGLELRIRPDVLLDLARAADELGLTPDTLATAALAAVLDLADEDKGLHFPLMLQQVEA